MNQSFACVGLQAIAADLELMKGLAGEFKAKYGSKIILYVRSPEEVRGLKFLKENGTVDEVVNCEIMRPTLRLPVDNAGDLFSRAQSWEEKTGETVTTLTFEHRQLSRGFFTGGLGNPRSPIVEGASYEQFVHAVCSTLEFWDNQIQSHGITLLVNAEKCGAAVARVRGIPYRRIFSGKFGGDHFWSPREYTTLPGLSETFHEIENWESPTTEKTYFAQGAKLERTWYLVSWRYILSSLFRTMTKGLLLSMFGSSRGNIRLWDALAMSFKARANYNRYNKLSVNTRLEDFKATPYVYFPLHKEPETYMLVSSPEYFNQSAAVIAIAKALPAGWKLVLKEHVPAFALRDKDYYNRLLDIKNVVLMPVEEPSVEIIKHAQIVATITGAAGLEASVLGIPTIQFGRHMINSFLPHVFTVYDDNDIPSFIRQVRNGAFTREDAARNGSKFRAALSRLCFKMPDFMLDFKVLSEQSIAAAFENLTQGVLAESESSEQAARQSA